MSQIANDNSTDGVSNDIMQPFHLEKSDFRGRVVRLNHVLNEVLSAHDYPPVISQKLGEALVITVLLGGMLKYEGIFTLQASGKEGIIRAIVCDMMSDGTIRGYVSYDEEAAEKLDESKDYSVKDLMGEGYLAFTVDQKMSERYQGIVELAPEKLMDSVDHYFKQSEQIMTSLRVSVHKDRSDDLWKAGAIMLQKLPEQDKLQVVDEDDWIRSDIFLQSCKSEELLDETLPLNDLLYRLFNEEGVIVSTPVELRKGCRCSRERVMSVLIGLSQDDIDYAQKEEGLEMVCEFCSKTYHFTREEIIKAREEN